MFNWKKKNKKLEGAMSKEEFYERVEKKNMRLYIQNLALEEYNNSAHETINVYRKELYNQNKANQRKSKQIRALRNKIELLESCVRFVWTYGEPLE